MHQLANIAAFFLAAGQPSADADLAKQLRDLDARVIVLGTVRQPPMASMLRADVEARLRAANRADRLAWEKVRNLGDWQRFRDRRIDALRASLGQFPPPPKDLKVRVTRRLEGDGYRIDNLVFESRPGLLVTANLYSPAKTTDSMPGLIVCHSHQSAKHTSWRQDMGMTWARAGCVVLVPDHLGHGERRQHPFDDPPHDYHFRYDAGIQLHLAGESLMGWLVWDLMRGVDVLLAQKGVDAKRTVMISEPAGGGDVAAVTAAIDPRIACVMVQNFGGPEPENAYPLPRDADESFDFAGAGSWESTRNLRLSAHDGFLPWTIVAATAPRRLMYFHEFYWDRQRDPVWKRLQRVYDFHQAGDHLVGLAGRGFVVGSAPENSHWLPGSRELLYPILQRWFAIPNPKKEFSNRRPLDELLCMTPALRKESKPLHVLVDELATQRIDGAREARRNVTPVEVRQKLQLDWTRLLGDCTPERAPTIQGDPLPSEKLGKITVERLHLSTEPGIVVPVLLLLPPNVKDQRLPVVVGVCQQGKQEMLRNRSGPIAEVLSAGIAVCLLDVRGTGETSPGEARHRQSAATAISSSEWMLGQSLLAGRLRDLRSVLQHLRNHANLDPKRIALWGDSLAPVNRADANFVVPHTAGDRPTSSEPLGGLLAMLGGLFEDDIRAVHVRRGLCDFRSVLEGPYCFVPHDVVIPGILTTGDLCDLAAAVAPRPLWLSNLVDGRNRSVTADEVARRYGPTRDSYAGVEASSRLRIDDESAEKTLAQWLTAQIGR